MSVEELINEIVERGEDTPKMVHYFTADNPHIGLCGTPLTGEIIWEWGHADCVVCEEMVKGLFR